MIIKPFKGFRPRPELAGKVAVLPNNLMNEPERKEAARLNPYSFAHVVKPKINFNGEVAKSEEELFQFARKYFRKLEDEKILVRDETPSFYIYRLSMQDHSQTGLISCVHVKNYEEGKIKKHEHTRAEKENENVMHIRNTELNSNPVFLAYNPVTEIDALIEKLTKSSLPEYNFVNEFGVEQELWVISDESTVNRIIALFDEKVPCAYIADGHHRAAAAAIYARQVQSKHDGESRIADHNYFLTCLFPADQLRIYDYNRLLKSLNGLTEKDFLKRFDEAFIVKPASRSPYQPSKPHRFGMYLNQTWYKLKSREGTFTNDPVGSLDVTILQNNVLDPILGIKDPRIDKRIDFVPGVKGLSVLEKTVDKGKAAVAFSLYPVTMQQLFAISDIGEVMPPKSTWFEPKLMSGLVIFKMEHGGEK